MIMHNYVWLCMIIIQWYMILHNYAWLCIIMDDYAWLCIIMHNYAWLCIIMHNYAWLCIMMHNYGWLCMIWAHWFGPGPICSILRFCHERGQIKRWGAVRHVIVSGIPMRVFFIFMFPQKKRFSDVWTCHVFWSVWTFFREKWFDPKVPQKCLGPSPTYSGTFSTHSGPKPPKQKY